MYIRWLKNSNQILWYRIEDEIRYFDITRMLRTVYRSFEYSIDLGILFFKILIILIIIRRTIVYGMKRNSCKFIG